MIGGFHLAPYRPEYIRQTIAALKEIGPDYVVPLHCSGEAFYEMMKAEIPTKLVRAFTGTRLIFRRTEAIFPPRAWAGGQSQSGGMRATGQVAASRG